MKSNLPSGWIERPLEELNQREAQSIDPGKYPDQTFELYSVPSFEGLIPEIITGSEIKSGKQRVDVGDVLICKINPRINRVWIVGEKGEHEQIGSTEWIVIKPVEGVLPEYLVHFCRSNKFRALLNSEISGVGGSLTRARPKLVAKYKVPLAPLTEQRRIVAQLDAVMQKLEASQERLDKLPNLLKKFRQAVLAAAMSGKLTEAWRAEQPKGETGVNLLNRVRAERRAQWEEKQRAKLLGKQLSLNDSWKSKYEEPAAPDTLELPELPEGWTYTSLLDISNRITDGTHQPPTFIEEGIPFVFVKHIMNGSIDFTDTRFISLTEYEQLNSRCPVEEGDILYSAVGSYGVAVPVETSRPFSFQRHIAHIKPTRAVVTNYVVYFLNSVIGLTQAHKVARGVAQKTVTLGELSKFAVPLPGREEQLEIVRQVNHYFGLADQLEARFEQAAALVEQLPQALLAKAFSGQLVPQDPNDEPTNVLLERLATEAPAPAKGKRGRKTTVTANASLFD